jgi:hypothetical protein
MYPRAFLQELIQLLESRGHLGPRARARVSSLIEQGIHPEQIFVGGGVVAPQTYREYLAKLSGLPSTYEWSDAITSELPPGFTREMVQRHQAVPLSHTDHVWVIGYLQPWDQRSQTRVQKLAETHGWQAQPAVLLKGEWQRTKMRSKLPVPPHVGPARSHLDALSARQVSEKWYLDPRHPRSGRKDIRSEEGVLPGSYLPALGRRLRRRHDPSVGVEIRALEHGIALRIYQAAALNLEHPSAWLQHRPETQKQGLTVLVGSDPWFRELTGPHTSQQWSIEGWREVPILYRKQPSSREQEELKHALLAGKSAIIHVLTPMPTWCEEIAAAGIPVRIIHKVVLPEGESWVSYDL